MAESLGVVPEIITDPAESARAVGLRYVSDREPGIRRIRRGAGFSYTGPRRNRIRDPEVLGRIHSLAIPPAWDDVWICPLARGHIQATGRDQRGRKQYKYHPRWREVRDESKYGRMIAFAKMLPVIRRRVARDMRRPGLSREKVLATVVNLLETTLIRVGNQEYARSNRSFGLTTLRDQHASVSGSKLRFQFRGKTGKRFIVDVNDGRLARIVKRCQDLPGYRLFQYVDDEGRRVSIDSADVNEYLRRIAGDDFTAKDFRTWAGTVLAAMALEEFEKFDSKAQAKRNVLRAIESVAKRLGNTPAICRKCYVHPVILESYLEEPRLLLEAMKQRTEEALSTSLDELRPEEAAVAGILQQRLARALSTGRYARPRRGHTMPRAGAHRPQRSRERARARAAV
jgi:DNA topoisomerase-1